MTVSFQGDGDVMPMKRRGRLELADMQTADETEILQRRRRGAHGGVVARFKTSEWSKLNENRCPENSNVYKQHDLILLHINKYLTHLLLIDFCIHFLDCKEKPN